MGYRRFAVMEEVYAKISFGTFLKRAREGKCIRGGREARRRKRFRYFFSRKNTVPEETLIRAGFAMSFSSSLGAGLCRGCGSFQAPWPQFV